MKTRLIALGGLVAAVLAAPAAAHDFTLGDLHIDHPYARENPRIGGAGGVFMTITNHGATDDTLVDASAPVSQRIELHTHIMDDGVMRMREIEGGMPVPAGETVDLQPGGLHVMLIGLEQPLVEGETFPMTLVFEQAGSVEVVVLIQDITAGAEHGHQGHMDHGDMDHGDMDHGGEPTHGTGGHGN